MGIGQLWVGAAGGWGAKWGLVHGLGCTARARRWLPQATALREWGSRAVQHTPLDSWCRELAPGVLGGGNPPSIGRAVVPAVCFGAGPHDGVSQQRVCHGAKSPAGAGPLQLGCLEHAGRAGGGCRGLGAGGGRVGEARGGWGACAQAFAHAVGCARLWWEAPAVSPHLQADAVGCPGMGRQGWGVWVGLGGGGGAWGVGGGVGSWGGGAHVERHHRAGMR